MEETSPPGSGRLMDGRRRKRASAGAASRRGADGVGRRWWGERREGERAHGLDQNGVRPRRIETTADTGGGEKKRR